MTETIQVNYDDQMDDAAYHAISAANKLLKGYGLKLSVESDNLPHDGYEILAIKLEKIGVEIPNPDYKPSIGGYNDGHYNPMYTDRT